MTSKPLGRLAASTKRVYVVLLRSTARKVLTTYFTAIVGRLSQHLLINQLGILGT